MKEYRVRFFHGDRDGEEDFMEFDSIEQAQHFYDSLDGNGEIQRYSEERHAYETIVEPEYAE